MEKISVIIPAYNVEQYLRQCLDSVVNQTYRNLEIILIDDGSPDNCGKICDEFAKKDSRVIVIHKQNAGLSAGWNDGLNIATGEWVAFVDSDDWIDVAFFEKMLNASNVKHADAILANANYEETEGVVRKAFAFSDPFFYENNTGRDYLMTKVLTVADGTGYGRIAVVWNKLYRRRLIEIEHLRFDEKIPAGMPNDALFNLGFFKKANIVAGIDYCGYHYRVLQGGGTRRYRPGRTELSVYTFEQVYKLLEGCEVSDSLYYMLNARIFEDVSMNLQREYFHPDNSANYKTVADEIKKMKTIPLYKDVIWQKENRFLRKRQIVLKYMLRLPWVAPVYMLNWGYSQYKKMRLRYLQSKKSEIDRGGAN